MDMVSSIVCRERAKGSSFGATIVGGFGGWWLVMGMAGAGVPIGIALAVVLPVFVLIACLGSVVRGHLPKLAEEDSPRKRQMMRLFAVVNVVEWLAIFGTINLLRNLHLDGWVVAAIVLIVGAHFLPLAQIFRTRAHLVTGIALMVCAAAAVVLPVAVRDVTECFAAGLILWASAAHALRTAFRMTPSQTLEIHA